MLSGWFVQFPNIVDTSAAEIEPPFIPARSLFADRRSRSLSMSYVLVNSEHGIDRSTPSSEQAATRDWGQLDSGPVDPATYDPSSVRFLSLGANLARGRTARRGHIRDFVGARPISAAASQR